MEVSYDELRRIQQKERSSGMLVELPEDFYSKAVELIKEMRGALTVSFTLTKAREYENTVKVLRDIYSLREQKLLTRALRSAKAPEPATGMPLEEREMFEKVRDVIAECETSFDASLNGTAKEIPSSRQKPMIQSDNSSLRMTSEVPQFMGVDGKPYGPFKAGESIIIPRNVAELLLKKKVASE